MPRTMQHRIFACLALLVGGLTAAPAPAQQPKGGKYALLVGVKQYNKNELRSLPYAETDVEGLAQALLAGGYRKENVLLMTQKAGALETDLLPTRENIHKLLAEFLKGRRPGDSILVAFAGHGVQFRGDKEHYFCPADARLDDKKKTLLALSEVYDQLRQCKAGFKLLLVDACRNDPVADASRSTRPEVKIESEFRAPAAPPGGVVALYSCSEGQKAYETGKFKRGIFYHFLIEGLKGKADANKDGKVTLSELTEYVRERVPDYVFAEHRVKQLPEQRGDVRGKVPPLVVLSKTAKKDSKTSVADKADRGRLKEFVSAEGRFKIVFPGKPKAFTNSEGGITSKRYMLQEKGRLMQISFFDLQIPEDEPEEATQDRLDRSRQSVLEGFQGIKLVRQSKIRLHDKHLGCEFEASLPNQGVARHRFYIVGRRIYHLFVIGTRASAHSAEANRFLDSLTLTD